MRKFPFAYDTKLKRPGCAILQAGLGGTASECWRFPTNTWLTEPTPDLVVYETTEDQLAMLVQITIANANKGDASGKP